MTDQTQQRRLISSQTSGEVSDAKTRAKKAQKMVDEGCVEIITTGSCYTCAQVKREKDCHSVVLYTDGDFVCNCEWGRLHSFTRNLCAHALAVTLRVMVEKEAT